MKKPERIVRRKSRAYDRMHRQLRLTWILFKEFRIFFVGIVLAWGISTWILYSFYPKDELPRHHASLLGTAYDTWQMIFFRPVIPFVDDWRLIPFFFGLPIIGLVVVADGLVRMGSLLLHRRRYSREWQKMLAATYEKHIVVCGLGNVGFRVVQQLRRFGEDVVCIEHNPEAAAMHEMEEYQVPVIIGDARDIKTLKNANIDKAKALVAVTDNDVANLEAALSAKKFHPGLRTVIRLFDQTLAEQVDGTFGIHCAFSPTALSAPVFAQAAISGNILASFDFAENPVNAVTLAVESDSPLAGMTIAAVRQEFRTIVIMLESKGESKWDPPTSHVLEEGDKLLIMVDHDAIDRLVEAEQRMSIV